jgi:hypothetical protein
MEKEEETILFNCKRKKILLFGDEMVQNSFEVLNKGNLKIYFTF